MKEFEIYFSDLSETAQQELLDLVGIDSPAEMNWDIVPIAMFNIEEGADEDPLY